MHNSPLRNSTKIKNYKETYFIFCAIFKHNNASEVLYQKLLLLAEWKLLKYVLVCFIMLMNFVTYGQEQEFVNDLSKHDSLEYLTLKQEITKYINANPDSSLVYISKIEVFSAEKSYKVGIVEAPYFKAFYFRRIQKLDSAIVYFDKASRLAEEYQYHKGIALAQNGLCRIYYFLGQTESALKAGEQCLSAAATINDLAIITDTYTALGNTYSRQNDFKKAIYYYLKADSIHTNHPQRPDIIAATFQNLGMVYEDLEDYDTAIKYFLKANDEFEKIPADVTFYLNTSNVHLGSAYYHQGKLERADSLLQKTYAYFKDIKEEGSVALTSRYIGLIRLKQARFAEAEQFLQECFQLNKDKKYSYETASAALELGKLYVEKKEAKKAIYYLNEVLLHYNEDDNTLLQQETLQSLAEAYAQHKDYENAFEALQTSFRLKDSLNTVQSLSNIKEIEAIYQTEKNVQEIALLRSENELVEQQKANQFNRLVGVIGFTSLAGIFFFFLYRNRQKTTKKLQELDKTKSSFFANISHEFRTPLTMILGPLQAQLQKENLKEADKPIFAMMHRNSTRLLSLVDQLLDISKLETGSMKLKVSKERISPFIGALADGFTYMALQKEINYSVTCDTTDVDTYFDADVVEKIVINLLSNAMKYTPEKGAISCNATVKRGELHFMVKNTGKGLSGDEISKIFERFYQVNNNKEGVGIGLALVKQLVDLHKGTISVESKENDWTTFRVVIPVSKARFTKDDFVAQRVSLAAEAEQPILKKEPAAIEAVDDIGNKAEQPILLIVDDNADIRTYVSSLFKNSYTILAAKDGQEGTDMAIEYIPDIIVSDIMMPVKNGIDLCNTLKVDERTSHIPIILLTAKAGEENQIEGIKTGADDYVTKPFNEELLKIRVEKLIENRKKLQLRYSQQLILKPKDIAITSVDEPFLASVQKVLDDQLIEPSFSVEDFSKAVGMSRMQLHRKLKALTGLSASAFIRSERLKLATQLFENPDINVSQVGYSVGFNDHAYFSKCFKEMYNCTPTEYVKSLRDNN